MRQLLQGMCDELGNVGPSDTIDIHLRLQACAVTLFDSDNFVQ